MNPSVNYRLELMKMYEYWLINYNKGTTLMQNVNNKGNYMARDIWEFYFSLNFAANLKMLFKKVYL